MAPKRGRPAEDATRPPHKENNEENNEEEDDDRSSDSDFDAEKNDALDVSEDETDDEPANEMAAASSGSKRKRDDDPADGSRKRIKAPEEVLSKINRSGGKRKQGRPRGRVSFADLDSGDEATINQAGNRSRRGQNTSITFDEDEDGGEGGWVKTRSQRALETEDDRVLVTTDSATINVDEVWSRLAALPIGRLPEEKQALVTEYNENDYITIKRTTRFAGEVTTEEKRVHKDSAEAKLYLEEQGHKQKQDENEALEKETESGEKNIQSTLRRPLKRLSRFEPNPTGEVKSLPPHLQLRWPRHKTAEAALAETSRYSAVKSQPAAKINTVDKSRQDWAGFVDKAGIAEELDKYGKSKSTYLGRQDFLNRTENLVEQDLRAARQKG